MKKRQREYKNNIIIILLLVLIFLSLLGVYELNRKYISVKDIDITLIEKPNKIVFYDKYSRNIASIDYMNRNQYWESDISSRVSNAFVALEDKRFYKHRGLDFIRIMKVVIDKIRAKPSGGGSSITQQLVKNVLLNNKPTMDRKIKEAILTFKIEGRYSKKYILESYLNNIYFGEGNYGIKLASKDYFGKEVKDLSIRESAMLAALINNPEKYNLRKLMYNDNDMKKINYRTNLCIEKMYQNKFITKKERDFAIKDAVFINKNKTFFPKSTMYKHPHFVEKALSDSISNYLFRKKLKKDKHNWSEAEKLFARKGFKIYTTMDLGIQNHLEEVVSNYNYPKLKNNGKIETSCVIEENNTGEIVAMIGSKDVPLEKGTFNRAIQAKVPVASIIKPLCIFAPAYDSGKNLTDKVSNDKTYIKGYDERLKYPAGEVLKKGDVTYMYALDHSQNVASARVLVNDVGYDKAGEYLKNLGISELEIDKSGNGLVLGTSLIPMIKILRGYQAIANDGKYISQRFIRKTVDNNGDEIKMDSPLEEQIYTKEGAKKTKENLRNVVLYGTGYACKNDKVTIYGKTGTHQNLSVDFAGFTKGYSGVLWIGSDRNYEFENQPLSEKIAAPLFNEIFSAYQFRDKNF